MTVIRNKRENTVHPNDLEDMNNSLRSALVQSPDSPVPKTPPPPVPPPPTGDSRDFTHDFILPVPDISPAPSKIDVSLRKLHNINIPYI